MKNEFTILGSGISAKIVASLLASKGFKTCLISDKDQNQQITNSNLVTFLSAGSLNYLSSMFPNMKFIREYPDIQTINCEHRSLNSKKNQTITFNNTNTETLGKIIKNTDLEKYFEKEISKLSNISVVDTDQPRVIENTLNGVKLKMDKGKDIDTDLFILSSTKKNIAHQSKIEFIKNDLKQKALSIRIKANIKNNHCAFQMFTSDGPLALLPYSKSEASVVWSLKNNSNILLQDEEGLTKTVSEYLNDYVSSIKIMSIEKHDLQFVYAKKLFIKNTVLLGNVAHNIHPIAGQGLNLSIKDIALFLKQIIKYKSLGYRLNDQMILENFEAQRKLDNASYSFGTFSLNGILSSNNKFLNFAARKGLGLVEKSTHLKKLFVRSATGNDFFKSL